MARESVVCQSRLANGCYSNRMRSSKWGRHGCSSNDWGARRGNWVLSPPHRRDQLSGPIPPLSQPHHQE
jgi:hypothetical protein